MDVKRHKGKGIMREMGVLLMIAVVYFSVCLAEPRFFSFESVINILLFVPFLLIVALGEMVEIISRNVDISLGSILAASSYAVGMIFVHNKEFPLLFAFLIAMAIGAVLGAINGLIVTKYAIPSVIVTLGTMNIYRGVIFILGGKQIDNSLLPKSLVKMSQSGASVVGIPYTVIIAVVLAVLVAVFLRRFRLGREIYAVGANPMAAKLKGISTQNITLFVFTLAGALAGLAGIVYMSRIGYLDPGAAGKGSEFTAIAAVVIGGTSMNGGIGTALGTVLGCILLGVINNAITILGISGYWQEAIYGTIIVVSVIMDGMIKKRMNKRIVAQEA